MTWHEFGVAVVFGLVGGFIGGFVVQGTAMLWLRFRVSRLVRQQMEWWDATYPACAYCGARSVGHCTLTRTRHGEEDVPFDVWFCGEHATTAQNAAAQVVEDGF